MSVNNSNFFESVQNYVPYRILTQLAKKDHNTFQRVRPSEGGIVFFDLVQFTGLTTALAETGPRGAEILQQLLENYYDKMVKIIQDFGGSVYQFAGDSALSALDKAEGESTEEVALRTIACALKMKEAADEFTSVKAGNMTFTLQTKISIGYGEYSQVILGDQQYFYDVTILGAPVARTVQGEKVASAGDIIIMDDLVSLLEDKISVTEGEVTKLQKANVTLPQPQNHDLPHPDDMASYLKKCSHFVAPALVEKIKTSYHGFVGEFRDVTSVFIKFGGIDYGKDVHFAVKQLNAFYSHVQKLSDVFGGILLQSDFSDKGNVFLVLFGAPIALEKKELMACRFASKLIQSGLEFPDISDIKIGISSGPSYCGDMGAKFRKGYTVLGESINIASRLMEYTSDRVPAMDAKTNRAVARYFDNIETSGVQLKGMKTPVDVYKLGDEKAQADGSSSQTELFIGRINEMNWLRERLVEIREEERGLTVAIMGDAGVGKSRLAYNFLEEARDNQASVWIGNCYTYEKFTPYFPWKQLLSKLFVFHDKMGDEQKLESITAKIRELNDVNEQWAPVLAKIIGMNVEEESFTATLDPKQKNDRTMEIIQELIHRHIRNKTLILVIEDYHWIDDSSEALIRFLTRDLRQNLMVLLLTRPEGHVQELKGFNRFRELDLQEFSDEDARNYVRLKLQLDAINAEMESHILTRAHGNPFFIESIVYSLREQGMLVAQKNGGYTLRGGVSEIEIPNTLQDVLLSRIDRLTEEEQATLKTAAVIGRLFAYEILKSLSPNPLQKNLNDYLLSLEHNDFTLLESDSPITYFFKHVLIRDVAYNSMLSSTRKELHRKLGGILEKEYDGNIRENADTLAYHFIEAGDKDKSLEYSLIAADKALSQYSNKDAAYYYNHALNVLKEKGVSDDDVQVLLIKDKLAKAYTGSAEYDRAIALYQETLKHWKQNIDKARAYQGLGNVYQQKGEMDAAIEMTEKALLLLGKKAPRSQLGVYAGIGGNLVVHEVNTTFPFTVRKVKSNTKKKAILEQRMLTLGILEKLYFFSDLEKMAWATMNSVLLADRLQDQELIAMAYANFGLIMTGLAFLKRADQSYQKSLDAAKTTNNPGVEAIAFSRYATKGFYGDDLLLWRTNLEKAVEQAKEVSNHWEMYSNMAQMAIAQIFLSNFEAAEKEFTTLAKAAAEQGLMIFPQWADLYVPFCRYILGKEDGEKTTENLLKATQVCSDNKDLAAVLTGYYYLHHVALREKNAENCQKFAIEAYDVAKSYDVFVPDSHIAYQTAAECAVFAMENGVSSDKALHKLIKKGLSKLQSWGKNFPIVLGPALRVMARYEHHKGNAKKAREGILHAIDVLERGLNRWETGNAYLNAAEIIEDKRTEYLDQAETIFKKSNIPRDIDRVKKARENYGIV